MLFLEYSDYLNAKNERNASAGTIFEQFSRFGDLVPSNEQSSLSSLAAGACRSLIKMI